MIEVNLFNVMGVGYLANMVAFDFTPLQPVKSKFVKFFPFISSHLDKLLNCSKCLGFWIGLIAFQNLPAAALTGLTGYLINYVMDRVKEWYE